MPEPKHRDQTAAGPEASDRRDNVVAFGRRAQTPPGQPRKRPSTGIRITLI